MFCLQRFVSIIIEFFAIFFDGAMTEHSLASYGVFP